MNLIAFLPKLFSICSENVPKYSRKGIFSLVPFYSIEQCTHREPGVRTAPADHQSTQDSPPWQIHARKKKWAVEEKAFDRLLGTPEFEDIVK